MKLGRAIATGLVVTLTALPSLAADKNGDYAIRGLGGQTCSNAISALEADGANVSAAISWLYGYSTAINRINTDTFDVSPVTDYTALLNMVFGVCRDLPDSLVETIAFDVLQMLSRGRVTTKSPLIETTSGETSAQVRLETLIAIQSRLNQIGYSVGVADGVFGSQTEAALRAFQESQQLPVTGVADSATIIRLLIELPS